MATLPASVLRHVVDVHCHPTDAPRISDESMARLDIRVCAMSTHKADQRCTTSHNCFLFTQAGRM
ncbi:hypothetical protein B0H10DRAFT_2018619 [Mycena sp. CBHHK59/15]|nr:hypothetical protein B0H10DRAFT_2018619 [Mycena sp. CBHHK59/15]